MSTAICTLFEGSYHLGLAALANSLHHSGFRGTLYCGFRGPLPPWAGGPRFKQLSDTESQWAASDGLVLHFIRLSAELHFTNYKPSFMLELLNGPARTADRLLYLDPDIVVKCDWPLLDSWAQEGIGLCEDVNANMPSRHPLRLQWMTWLQSWKTPSIQVPRERYYSAGFVGIDRNRGDFLRLWEEVIKQVGKYLGDLGKLKTGHAGSLFHTPDQDALNIALMISQIPINATGPDGMDFTSGGHMLSHAIGSRKPWTSNFIIDALKGYPPSMAQKCYFDHIDTPISVYPPATRLRRKAALQLAALIGRFYCRR